MRRGQKVYIVSLISLLFLTALPDDLQAVGGAWTKQKGGYYLGLGFGSTSGENDRGFRGEERPLYRDTLRFAGGSLGISNFTLYNEFGWTDWLTTQLSARYTVIVREADIIERGSEGLTINESASGFGDAWLGARLRLPTPTEWMVAAFNLDWKIPLGSTATEIPLGTGAADYEASLAVGAPFTIAEDRHGYFQGGIGYRLRNRAEDELVWRLQGGVAVIPTLGLELTLDGVDSFADFENAEESDDDPIFNDIVGSQSWLHLTGGLTYALNDWTDLLVKYTTTLDGRNTLDGATISVGVAWKWDGSSEL